MDIIAKSKSIRVSPRKARLVTEAVKKMPLEQALMVLTTLKKRGAIDLEKTIRGAIANATKNKNLQRESLMIKTIDVFGGPAFRRYHPSTRGRIHPYKKRTSHITVVLTDNQSAEKVMPLAKEELKENKKEIKKEEKNGTKS
ncbi:MAG: 50S ribosomal protein L22 [Candidatus Levybacteria bacterium RBG_16_35_6]|nr:MAG: 50S ribosomal protein L22 [Candidatus Levybacteria bacterium RBG_16_35_6]